MTASSCLEKCIFKEPRNAALFLFSAREIFVEVSAESIEVIAGLDRRWQVDSIKVDFFLL